MRETHTHTHTHTHTQEREYRWCVSLVLAKAVPEAVSEAVPEAVPEGVLQSLPCNHASPPLDVKCLRWVSGRAGGRWAVVD